MKKKMSGESEKENKEIQGNLLNSTKSERIIETGGSSDKHSDRGQSTIQQ